MTPDPKQFGVTWRGRLGRIALKTGVPVVLLVAWHVLAVSGLVHRIFLASPSETVTALLELVSTGLGVEAAGTTLWRVFQGLIVATTVGIPIGLLMGLSRPLYDAFEFPIDFARSIPATSLLPIFILVFGISGAQTALVATAGSLILVVKASYGARYASETRLATAKVFGLRGWRLISIVFHEALPEIAAGFRVLISLALVMVVVTEIFTGPASGLGYLIYESHLLRETGRMYGAIVLTGLIGYLVNQLFLVAERKLLHWVGK